MWSSANGTCSSGSVLPTGFECELLSRQAANNMAKVCISEQFREIGIGIFRRMLTFSVDVSRSRLEISRLICFFDLLEGARSRERMTTSTREHGSTGARELKMLLSNVQGKSHRRRVNDSF